MSPASWPYRNPLGAGNVISTVRTLMRTDGLNVSVTAIARASGTSRNYLYENWKTASRLHPRALQAELARAFDEADRTHPSDGTVDGIVRHLTQVVRIVRRHPTTAAVARTSHTALPRAHAATDGPLVQMITGRVSDLLHPLARAAACGAMPPCSPGLGRSCGSPVPPLSVPRPSVTRSGRTPWTGPSPSCCAICSPLGPRRTEHGPGFTARPKSEHSPRPTPMDTVAW
ncbi:hypothetical protein LV779_03525 [Streptomyces thinghirensis]|nr:hypothetical protein [Streptomyces thinghirensis]